MNDKQRIIELLNTLNDEQLFYIYNLLSIMFGSH